MIIFIFLEIFWVSALGETQYIWKEPDLGGFNLNAAPLHCTLRIELLVTPDIFMALVCLYPYTWHYVNFHLNEQKIEYDCFSYRK